MSPAASKFEAVAAKWITELLRLPTDTGIGFVTGSTAAHTTALLAARRAVYQKVGWDVDRQGLQGAPNITVVATDDLHASVLKALGIVGLGRDTVIRVPVDGEGRMVIGRVPALGPSTILIAQAGNVNSGSFDDVRALADLAQRAGAWLHLDGAFGVWARTSPKFTHLITGLERADSIATSAHKLMNAPYDSAIVTCRDARTIEDALSITTAYAIQSGEREPNHFTPEGSRRARRRLGDTEVPRIKRFRGAYRVLRGEREAIRRGPCSGRHPDPERRRFQSGPLQPGANRRAGPAARAYPSRGDVLGRADHVARRARMPGKLLWMVHYARGYRAIGRGCAYRELAEIFVVTKRVARAAG